MSLKKGIKGEKRPATVAGAFTFPRLILVRAAWSFPVDVVC